MIKSLSVVAVVLFAQASFAVDIPKFPEVLVSVCKFADLKVDASMGISRKIQVVDGIEHSSIVVTGEVQSKSGQVVKALRDCNNLSGGYHCAFQVDANTRLELTGAFNNETKAVAKAGIVAWRNDSPKAYVTKDCSASLVQVSVPK